MSKSTEQVLAKRRASLQRELQSLELERELLELELREVERRIRLDRLAVPVDEAS